MTVVPDTEAPKRKSWRPLPPLALVPLAALVWWLAGFLPWLLNGDTQEALRNLGASTVVLPLFAGNLSVLVLGAGVGGVTAGLTVLVSTGSRAARAGACAAGVAIALLITLIQSRNGLNGSIDDGRVTNGLTVIVVLVTLVGLALGLLALTGRVGLGLALASLAGATPVWLMNMPFIGSNGAPIQDIDEFSRWAGAALLAFALVVIGVKPPVRVVAWSGAVLLAWFIAPTITAAAYAQLYLRAGMGEVWDEHFSATMDMWQQALSLGVRPLTPWVVAVLVAVAISLWLARRESPVGAEEPSAGS